MSFFEWYKWFRYAVFLRFFRSTCSVLFVWPLLVHPFFPFICSSRSSLSVVHVLTSNTRSLVLRLWKLQSFSIALVFDNDFVVFLYLIDLHEKCLLVDCICFLSLNSIFCASRVFYHFWFCLLRFGFPILLFGVLFRVPLPLESLVVSFPLSYSSRLSLIFLLCKLFQWLCLFFLYPAWLFLATVGKCKPFSNLFFFHRGTQFVIRFVYYFLGVLKFFIS